MFKTLKEMLHCLFNMKEYTSPCDYTYFTSRSDAIRFAEMVHKEVETGIWAIPIGMQCDVASYNYRLKAV